MRLLFIFLLLAFFQPLLAATSDDYLQACNEHEGKRFGAEFCDCMLEKSKDLNQDELDFLYAITTKDREKANEGVETLDVNQKTKVIQITVLGPSQCNKELANKSTTAENDEPASTITDENDSSM